MKTRFHSHFHYVEHYVYNCIKSTLMKLFSENIYMLFFLDSLSLKHYNINIYQNARGNTKRMEDTSKKEDRCALCEINHPHPERVQFALKHKLDDFFVGHQDLALSLARPDGSVFYQRAVGESSPGSARVARCLRRPVPFWTAPGCRGSACRAITTFPC